MIEHPQPNVHLQSGTQLDGLVPLELLDEHCGKSVIHLQAKNEKGEEDP